VLLVAALVGVPLALSAMVGAWAVPHNDAWSHSKIAETFAQTGRVELVGWNRAALIGQFVILGPLGSSIIVQHLSVAVWAVVALVSIYLVLLPRVGRTVALWSLAAIGLTSEFALLSTSFMTDVPMLGGVMASVAMMDRATRSGRLGWYGGALAASLWASTVRETAVAALVAVIVIGQVTWRGSRRRAALGLAAIAVAALTMFEAWRRALPDNDSPWLLFTPGLTVKSLLLAALAVGLILAPVIALVVRPRTWPTRSWASFGVVLVLGLAWVTMRGADAVFGNYLTTRGAYPTVFDSTPEVIPPWVLVALALLGTVATALAVAHVVALRPSIDVTAGIFGVLLLATTFGPSLLGQELFARSVLPLLPFAVILLGKHVAGRGVLVSGALLTATGVVALLVMLQAMSLDVARWSFAELLAAQGWPPTAIDAGLEWNGTHAEGAFTLGDLLPVCPNPGATQQGIVITAEPGPDEPVAEWTYRRFAIGTVSTLYAVPGPACGP
jgi:hypothetical protein